MKLTFKTKNYDIELEGESFNEIKQRHLEIKKELDKEFPQNASDNKGVLETKKNKKKSNSIADKIISLAEEEFFNAPKTMNEIKEKLAEQGFHYPLTYLPPYLIQLIKTKKLRRFKEKKDGKEVWVYVNP